MRESRTCPKCHSTDVIEHVRVVDRSDSGTRDLSASFPGPTVAGLFRFPQHFPLSAWVCASCGYTELYAAQPEKIRSVRERVATEGRAPAWGPSSMESDSRLSGRRGALVAIAVALAVGAGLLVVLVLLATGAK